MYQQAVDNSNTVIIIITIAIVIVLIIIIILIMVILGGIHDRLQQKGLESQTPSSPLTGENFQDHRHHAHHHHHRHHQYHDYDGQANTPRRKAVPASSSLPEHKSLWVSGRECKIANFDTRSNIMLINMISD